MANQRVQIVETTVEHVRSLIPHLRPEDRALSERFHAKADRALWRACKRSFHVRTAIAEGKVMAIWGMEGVYLGNVGRPWLLMSADMAAHPTRIVFCYRRELRSMLKTFPVLVDMVEAHRESTLRLLKVLGFTLSDPMPWYRGELYVRAEKR